MSKSTRRQPRTSALAGSSPVQPAVPTPRPSAPAAPQEQPTEAEAKGVDQKPKSNKSDQNNKTDKTRKTASTAAGATDTVRVGIYISAEDLDGARGAYLADWQDGGEADTFTKWVSDAITTHAARTAAERTELARPVVRSETRSGDTRTFNVSTDALERMNAAIVDDQDAGRWPSTSAWCGDAIAAATARARERTGGTLPIPPARLPNRLRRR